MQEDAGSEGRWAPHSGSMGRGRSCPERDPAEELEQGLQEACPKTNTGAPSTASTH